MNINSNKKTKIIKEIIPMYFSYLTNYVTYEDFGIILEKNRKCFSYIKDDINKYSKYYIVVFKGICYTIYFINKNIDEMTLIHVISENGLKSECMLFEIFLFFNLLNISENQNEKEIFARFNFDTIN